MNKNYFIPSASLFLLLTYNLSIFAQEAGISKQDKKNAISEMQAETIIDEKMVDTDTKIYLETNISFASSTEDNRSDAQAGLGTLGIKFERKFVYGAVRFTVYSRNDEIIADNNSDIKIFGSNLLIPSNSSNNISNFSFLLGTKSFYNYDNVEESVDLFSRQRFGGYLRFSIHNTTWIKETVDPLAITINSLDVNLTYRLLSLILLGEENGKANLYLEVGYSKRRLGGDYGLDINKDKRNEFIGTDELGFDAINLGARLEVSNFFGQVNLTNFGDKGIAGFSGNQAVITIGFKADLNILAYDSKDAK